MKSLKKKRSMGLVTVGEKGQIVIPKDMREMFEIRSGSTLMVLADEKRGIAIVPPRDFARVSKKLFEAQNKKGDGNGSH